MTQRVQSVGAINEGARLSNPGRTIGSTNSSSPPPFLTEMLHQLYFTYVAIRLLVISILSTSLRDLFLLCKTVTAPRILTYSLKINSKIHFYTFDPTDPHEKPIYTTERAIDIPNFSQILRTSDFHCLPRDHTNQRRQPYVPAFTFNDFERANTWRVVPPGVTLYTVRRFVRRSRSARWVTLIHEDKATSGELQRRNRLSLLSRRLQPLKNLNQTFLRKVTRIV